MSTEEKSLRSVDTNKIVAGTASALVTMTDDEFNHMLVAQQTLRARTKKIFTSVMEEDVHYGKIPGTGKKPSLLKPGCDVAAQILQVHAEFEYDRHLEDGGQHVTYIATCRLYRYHELELPVSTVLDEQGNPLRTHYQAPVRELVSQESATCSTRENKYATRKEWFGERGNRQSREIENPNPRDQENTILRMASKRAKVAAVLSIGLSEIFTGEIEDDAETGDERTQKSSGRSGGSDAKKNLTQGQRTMVEQRAKERAAKILPEEAPDEARAEAAGEILSAVLEAQSLKSLEDAKQSQLPDLVQAIAKFEPPSTEPEPANENQDAPAEGEGDGNDAA